jgi:hypothetical protein
MNLCQEFGIEIWMVMVSGLNDLIMVSGNDMDTAIISIQINSVKKSLKLKCCQGIWEQIVLVMVKNCTSKSKTLTACTEVRSER